MWGTGTCCRSMQCSCRVDLLVGSSAMECLDWCSRHVHVKVKTLYTTLVSHCSCSFCTQQSRVYFTNMAAMDTSVEGSATGLSEEEHAAFQVATLESRYRLCTTTIIPTSCPSRTYCAHVTGPSLNTHEHPRHPRNGSSPASTQNRAQARYDTRLCIILRCSIIPGCTTTSGVRVA